MAFQTETRRGCVELSWRNRSLPTRWPPITESKPSFDEDLTRTVVYHTVVQCETFYKSSFVEFDSLLFVPHESKGYIVLCAFNFGPLSAWRTWTHRCSSETISLPTLFTPSLALALDLGLFIPDPLLYALVKMPSSTPGNVSINHFPMPLIIIDILLSFKWLKQTQGTLSKSFNASKSAPVRQLPSRARITHCTAKESHVLTSYGDLHNDETDPRVPRKFVRPLNARRRSKNHVSLHLCTPDYCISWTWSFTGKTKDVLYSILSLHDSRRRCFHPSLMLSSSNTCMMLLFPVASLGDLFRNVKLYSIFVSWSFVLNALKIYLNFCRIRIFRECYSNTFLESQCTLQWRR